MENIFSKINEKFSNKMLKVDKKSERRVYCDCKPQDIAAAARFLFKDLKCRFATASGMDTPSGIEILYHFSYDPTGEMITFRTILTNKKHPEIESIAPIIKGAEWIEREMWEMLGVNFKGHPNLKHLLLIDDWPEGKHPLRHEQNGEQPKGANHEP